ncbi:hypothetical protein F0562_024547 [Nyssa sinensis]|uniref:PPPDE domain-containing protein n=1 Tax=Nyssa sinensis TaxID=561372 RepID=A0A5J5BCZ3_9ASTE|nr:hypothetical protein F0562_024547 [Nyssa sinensis]
MFMISPPLMATRTGSASVSTILAFKFMELNMHLELTSYPTTGIFEGEPKKCDGFTFRKAILMGWTEMSRTEVRKVMVELAEKYRGNAYNLIAKNCNHFCNDACVRLTGNPIPSWVNRLARIGKGLWCYCIIPVSLNSTKVHNDRIEDKVCESEGDKKKLRSRSNRFTSSSNSISSSSAAATSSSRSRCSLPPSSPLLLGPTSS